MNDPIVVFDLETDSLKDDCQIIQLAAIAIVDFTTILAEINLKLRFDINLSDPTALEINGYNEADWADAAHPGDACEIFADWLAPFRCDAKISQAGKAYRVAKLCGYNSQAFDMPRLIKLFKTYGIFLPADFISLDVLQLVSWLYFREKIKPVNFQLDTVRQFLKIEEVGTAHDALRDTKVTAMIAAKALG